MIFAGCFTRLLRLLLSLAALGATGILALGIALRIAGYDEEGNLLAFYYGLPWPVLAAIALMLFVYHRRGRWLALLFGLLWLGCVAGWLQASYRLNAPVEARDSLRIVYWNAAGPQRRVAQVIAEAKALNADILGIGECGSSDPAARRLWQTEFAGRTVVELGGKMMLVTSGIVREQRFGLLDFSGRYSVVTLEVRGRTLRLVVVDLDANATLSRKRAFNKLGELLAANKETHILMGDFNTPGDSVHFQRLPRTLCDAFATAGRGFSETWPVPLPVLALDHIYLAKPLRPIRCILGWSWLSDHRPIIADVAME